MALSIEKLLNDAHTLVMHLRDHDSLADNIIGNNQGLLNKVEAMKQYQDDLTELNEIAKHRPRSNLVLGIAQENRQIRELQQENRELEASLEEHQSALELIMQKYREHTVKLLQGNRLERALADKEVAEKDSMCQLMGKIDEMAGIMQKAIEVDESSASEDKEKLSRLEIENKGLRELLEICSTSSQKIVDPLSHEVDDDDDDATDTECDTSVISNPAVLKKEDTVDQDIDKDKSTEKDKNKEEEPKKKTVASKGAEREVQPSSASGKNSPTVSKSAGDIRRTKPLASKTDSVVKKSSSVTSVKREPLKKSSSVDNKKDTKKPAGKAVVKK